MAVELPLDTANRLLSLPDTVKDEELSELVRSGLYEAYRLNDGRVLKASFSSTDGILPDGTPVRMRDEPGLASARIYESREELISELRELAKVVVTEMRVVSFKDSFPLGDQFLEQIPDLIQALPVMLNIREEQCDFSIESLTVIENAVRKLGRQHVLEPDIFQPLLAYLGTLVAKQTNGYLKMVQSVRGDWHPHIIIPPNIESRVLIYLFRQLSKYPSEPAIDEFMLMVINKQLYFDR